MSARRHQLESSLWQERILCRINRAFVKLMRMTCTAQYASNCTSGREDGYVPSLVVVTRYSSVRSIFQLRPKGIVVACHSPLSMLVSHARLIRGDPAGDGAPRDRLRGTQQLACSMLLSRFSPLSSDGERERDKKRVADTHTPTAAWFASACPTTATAEAAAGPLACSLTVSRSRDLPSGTRSRLTRFDGEDFARRPTLCIPLHAALAEC